MKRRNNIEVEMLTCIFCGESGGLDMHNPQGRNSKLRGPYHQTCRNKVWNFGRHHPENQAELNRLYGLEWNIRKQKTADDYNLPLGGEEKCSTL